MDRLRSIVLSRYRKKKDGNGEIKGTWKGEGYLMKEENT